MRERSPAEPRRRFRRRTVRILVDFAAPTGVRCEYATTLGAGGAFIETDEPLPVGSPIKVRFRLTQSELAHEIEGRVAWSLVPAPGGEALRAPGMGVEFVDSTAIARLARELEDLPS